MIAAMVIAIAIMLLAAPATTAFVNSHPTVKMLALSFLLLVGAALVADSLHFHIPRGYLYFAIAFSMGVEGLNLVERAAGSAAPAGRHAATRLARLSRPMDRAEGQPAFRIRKRNSPASASLATSSWPAAWQNARTSLTVPGSVASSRSNAPGASFCIALRARSTGSGHCSPRVSRSISATGGIPAIGSILYVNSPCGEDAIRAANRLG